MADENAGSFQPTQTDGVQDEAAAKKTRRTSLFPASTFEDSLELPTAILKAGAGQPVRRITLLDEMKKSPSSGPTRQMITNSSKYGLTTGSYNAETLALTPMGKTAVDDSISDAQKTKARFELAIRGVDVFSRMYDTYLDNRLPSQAVLMDKAKEFGVPVADLTECVETFTVNTKFIGVLRSISGAERFISIDTLVDDFLPRPADGGGGTGGGISLTPRVRSAIAAEPQSDYSKVCFYVTPIGEDGSDERKHSDLFMGSLVEPALAEFGLTVVRADQIGDAGMITSQIIEYLMHSRLVVADLSFHNPNVFYELALRHAIRKPMVQISRASDRLPFDIGQVRTVVIDTTDIYTLVPQLSSLQAQIAAQIRKTLDEGKEVENSLSVFAPTFWSNLPTS